MIFERRTGPLRRLRVIPFAALMTFLAALAQAPGAEANETVTFGMDFAAAGDPFLAIFPSTTEANLSGTSAVLPAGITAPHDGTITGWRLEVAGPANVTEALQFRVIRGTTSIYVGPSINFTSTGSAATSRTIAENVPVHQGDLIGVTYAGGSNIAIVYNGPAVAGNTAGRWNNPYSETETRNPNQTFGSYSVAVQADLSFAPPTSASPTCAALTPTIVGTAGNDTRIGTPGPDVIAGLGGDDTLIGLGGDDVICGGDGNDKIKGGAGIDRLYGEAGRDKIRGGGSTDRCSGGADKDSIDCEKTKQH